MPEKSEMFAAIDALIASQAPLPPPAERERLRKAHGLTQEQVAQALGVRRPTVVAWENGKTDPRGEQRAGYARLLDKLTELYPADPAQPTAPSAARAPRPRTTAAQAPPAPVEAEAAAADAGEPADAPAATPPLPAEPARPARTPAAPAPAPAAVTPRADRPAPARRTTTKAEPPKTTTVAREYANGPLAVLDVTGGKVSAYCVGGLVLDCPAKTIPALVEWALNVAALGAPRLNQNGKDADPLIVLTASAVEYFGLPPVLEDRRGLRLPEDHKAVRQLTKAKWQLTRRGFGPWARIYRPVKGGQRQCVQLAVLPWEALDSRAWGKTGELPAPEVAHVVGTYASRVITPRGSIAVTGLELMTALHPPTRAVEGEKAGTWVSGHNPGSLGKEPVDPAPPEAPDEHPILAGLYPRDHVRTADQVLGEEAFDWFRSPELLTDAECSKAWAVGIDVNMAFLAATNRLILGLCAPVHLKRPRFDKKLPGCWLIDLSGIEFDPRLPNPFTPTGERPEGPAWYATPTVAYAYELIATYHLPITLTPLEAWVRPDNGPYLDPWYKHLNEAYKATMADLGVKTDMSEADFLTAMAGHKTANPHMAAVLSAIKSTAKGGIGKLRERPRGKSYQPGEPWPALARPTWRPDIRAAIVSSARVNMHRKLIKTAIASQTSTAPVGHLRFDDDALLPVGILSDAAVYLSDSESPAELLPHTPDGKPAPGTFRLGVSPGMVKHEGTRDLMWAVGLLDQGHNPANFIKPTDDTHDE
ncbi:telomere-associated protein Tap [Streptomyces sp. PA03-2a]|uniref:telomere-associated protein Tap n=1 Tax=Streptomyces sp. PA03-2a TaxID=3028701 RepID=UPI0029BD8078|nr:helix-turn-helix domain-containing protein [Streptomyces sp. PA03-2a]MDX2733456.1 helix-turn-helix domain-containing protein [Streptomyces sp. PA03-2a]